MTELRGDRPHIPGDGFPSSLNGIRPWSWAVERLERATIYWLAIAGTDSAPHLIPIWGSWVDGHWYVEAVRRAGSATCARTPRWRSRWRSATRS